MLCLPPIPSLNQVNVSSLEDVIKYLLKVASDRAEEASKAAEAKLDVEVRARGLKPRCRSWQRRHRVGVKGV